MLGKKDGQIDIFNNMIYEELIPKDHLLVKIDALIDFSFVYDLVQDNYSDIGRKSEDPVVLYKLNLLEYLYKLSDPAVASRAQTDIAFRWFLGLNLDDKVPDDTTISYFRIHRLGEDKIEEIFNEIVKKCIENNLIGERRYIADSTDVAANVNYPSIRRLICNAFRKVIREIYKFNSPFAEDMLDSFEGEIDLEYDKSDKVPISKFCEIARKYAGHIYLKTYDELQDNEKYIDAYSILWNIINQYSNSNSKDKIISCVDPDARVAHKSPGVKKRGYKDHIIIDEDSGIILASTQTPFNVGDEKELTKLIEKANDNFGLKPKEISADKVYGTTENRAYLKDNEITSNIDFYDKSNKEFSRFDITKFDISEDLNSAKCPSGVVSTKCIVSQKSGERTYKFDNRFCLHCSLRNQCLSEKELQKFKARTIKISTRYDATIHDMIRLSTDGFKDAINKRYKVESRFATLVRNNWLRRNRFLRLKGAKIHIMLANTACNIVRMVNLLFDKTKPNFANAKFNI